MELVYQIYINPTSPLRFRQVRLAEGVDLGTDVAPERIVDAAREGVDLHGLSSLLTTTMPSIKATIYALHEAGLRDSVKVIVGAAPDTDKYA
jgi:5-methyltetrahydrofolate--homocysteine methyltransferase